MGYIGRGVWRARVETCCLSTPRTASLGLHTVLHTADCTGEGCRTCGRIATPPLPPDRRSAHPCPPSPGAGRRGGCCCRCRCRRGSHSHFHFRFRFDPRTWTRTLGAAQIRRWGGRSTRVPNFPSFPSLGRASREFPSFPSFSSFPTRPRRGRALQCLEATSLRSPHQRG